MSYHLTVTQALSYSLRLFLTVGLTGRNIGISPLAQVPERQNIAITVKGKNYKNHASLMKDTGIVILSGSSDSKFELPMSLSCQ